MKNFKITIFIVILIGAEKMSPQNYTCEKSNYTFTENYYTIEPYIEIYKLPSDTKRDYNFGIKGSSLNGAIEVRLYDPLWMGNNINDGFLWGTRIENKNTTDFEGSGWFVSPINPLYPQMMSNDYVLFKSSIIAQIVQRCLGLGAVLIAGNNPWEPYSFLNIFYTFPIAVVIEFEGYTTIKDLEGLKLPGLGVLSQDYIYKKLGLSCLNSQNKIRLNPNKIEESFYAYPNPSNGKFEIDFFLKEVDLVSLKILDLEGKLVFEQKNKSFKKGNNKFSFDLANKLSSGIYFLKIDSNKFSETLKIIIE